MTVSTPSNLYLSLPFSSGITPTSDLGPAIASKPWSAAFGSTELSVLHVQTQMPLGIPHLNASLNFLS